MLGSLFQDASQKWRDIIYRRIHNKALILWIVWNQCLVCEGWMALSSRLWGGIQSRFSKPLIWIVFISSNFQKGVTGGCRWVLFRMWRTISFCVPIYPLDGIADVQIKVEVGVKDFRDTVRRGMLRRRLGAEHKARTGYYPTSRW